jgi:hypothetical protein
MQLCTVCMRLYNDSAACRRPRRGRREGSGIRDAGREEAARGGREIRETTSAKKFGANMMVMMTISMARRSNKPHALRVARPSMCQRPGQQLPITNVQPQSHNHVTRNHRPQIFCFFPTRATDPCQPPLDETPTRRSAPSPFPLSIL